MMKYTLVIIAGCMLMINLHAQDNEYSAFCFSHQPFYMINNTFKTDVDVLLGNGNWLIISPVFAARENHVDDDFYYDYEDGFNKLLGYGLTLGHRMYGKPSEIPKGVYFSYQAGWNHYKLHYRDLTWGNFNFEGLDAYTYDYYTMSTIIDKLGLDIIVGYQFVIKGALLLDVYIGGGIRYSMKAFTGTQEKEFNYSFTDYGYTGLLPQGGFRLGIVL